MNIAQSVQWHLRELLAEHGIYQTTNLVPLLAEHGIHLSREQVYRLVTQTPQRLNLETLGALCDILGCGPGDLISFTAAAAVKPQQTAATANRRTSPTTASRPTRTLLRRPNEPTT